MTADQREREMAVRMSRGLRGGTTRVSARASPTASSPVAPPARCLSGG